MAEVEIQPKRGAIPAWAWLLGAVLLIGIVWWIWAANTNGREVAVNASTVPIPAPGPAVPPVTEGTTSEGTTAGAEAANPELPLAAIKANPDNYFGKPVSGLATVTEVVGDRGFVVEQDGEKMLLVKDEAVAGTNVVVGNKVSFTGTVMDPQHMQQVQGILQMPESVLKDLQNEPAFIKATNIEVQNN